MRSLLAELKRRNVHRAAAFYAALAWLLIQIATQVFPFFDFPNSSIRLIVVAAIVGLPFALLFSWFYEWTPQGLKRERDAAPDEPVTRPGGRALDRWISVMLALAVALLLADKWAMHRGGDPAAASAPEESIAVLPFADMSEKNDEEYFADGLSEELLDLLSKVQNLHVAARTSSFSFKGRLDDIPTIAHKLLVAYVLEGSVRKSGNLLRITAQLVRADTGYHLWSATYDRKVDDIFKIQDDIAASVVKALRVSLVRHVAPKAQPTRNPEAYTLFLQGRTMYRHATTRVQYENAVDYLQKAIDADGAFAAAWATLATVRKDEWIDGFIDYESASADARRAAQHALTLDPTLANAHKAIGSIYLVFDWDWKAAAAELQEAYESNPADAGNVRSLADVKFILGGDDAIALGLYRKAVELDPVYDLNYGRLAGVLYCIGQLADAETAVRQAIDLNPTQRQWSDLLGSVLLARGQSAKALAEIERMAGPSVYARAQVYATLGRRADADAALQELERIDAPIAAYGIAQIHAHRGETDQAFEWLERAYQQHDSTLPYVKRDPALKSIRDDPRYRRFLSKMHLQD